MLDLNFICSACDIKMRTHANYSIDARSSSFLFIFIFVCCFFFFFLGQCKIKSASITLSQSHKNSWHRQKIKKKKNNYTWVNDVNFTTSILHFCHFIEINCFNNFYIFRNKQTSKINAYDEKKRNKKNSYAQT